MHEVWSQISVTMKILSPALEKSLAGFCLPKRKEIYENTAPHQRGVGIY